MRDQMQGIKGAGPFGILDIGSGEKEETTRDGWTWGEKAGFEGIDVWEVRARGQGGSVM